jgi:hypothetical protein
MAMTPDRRHHTIASVLKLEGALHRMNMGDKLNIIDNSNAFLFMI